jgi:hypothetical protein
LDREGCIYLDDTGCGLYGGSQVGRHAAMLREHPYGNPHGDWSGRTIGP